MAIISQPAVRRRTQSKPTSIYALRMVSEDLPRYVGKTSQEVKYRLSGHWNRSNSSNLPVSRWLAKMNRVGERVVAETLEVVPIGDDWGMRERFWIEEFRSKGARLLNLTKGGEGLSGLIFTDGHREKIASSLRKGAEFPCMNCERTFWRKPHAIRNGDAKYCSKACYFEGQKGVSKGVGIDHSKAIAAAAAARRAMTHCRRGHEYSEANTRFNHKGARICRECVRASKIRREAIHVR